jgi:WD40 repeat protein
MTTVFESNQGALLLNMREAGGSPRAFSADGKIIAGAFNGNRVLVFAAGSDRPLAQLNDCIARALSLSADGGRLAVGCQGQVGGEARIMDILTNKVVGKVRYLSARHLVISPDGKMVFSLGRKRATGFEAGATVFEAEGEDRVVQVIGGDAFSAIAFDLSAKHLAVALGSRDAKVFEISSDEQPKLFGRDELIESVAFSPDGKRVALGARSRFAYVYDIDTGQLIAKLDHKEEEKEVLRVKSIVFSRDGQLLASTAVDPTRMAVEKRETLRVFSITGKELIRVPLDETPVYMSISPDQAFLEVAVGDKDIRLVRFPIRAQDLIEDACSRVTRNLKQAEWVRYLPDTPYRETCTELNPAAAEVE